MTEITHNNLPEAVTQLFSKLDIIEKLLNNNNQAVSQPESKQHLIIQDASEVIHLSVATIYGLVSRNEIPFFKKGKRLYFSKEDLINWIQEGRKKTISEIKEEVDTYAKLKGGKAA